MNKNMKGSRTLAIRKAAKEKDCTCKRCGKAYSKRALSMALGKESTPVILGYCSAFCYTKQFIGEVNANKRCTSVMQQD